MQLKPGSTLKGGEYKIIKPLGQGGFGITYLAEQTELERQVCIKEFFMKDFCDRDEATSQVSLGTSANQALMQKYQEKFKKEARMIAKLNHPNIIRIHDVFSENNTAYYVMDYIDGTSLNEIVKAKGALSELESLRIVRAIGEGLKYVHGKNITHLDVKPGNIMIRKEDSRPVLIDFGMSKQYDESGDQTSSTPIGISAGYAPLEQYQAGGVNSFSPQTDIYSLAATLYRLLTGQVPPSASDIMNEGLPALPETISAKMRAAIGKGMQFRKKDRPATMAEFLSLLDVETVPKTATNPAPEKKAPVKKIPVEKVTPVVAQKENATDCPKTHLIKAILFTILLCLPLGIPAIVNAAGVSKAFDSGNYQLAEQKSKNAEMWCKVSLIFGIVAYVILLILSFI